MTDMIIEQLDPKEVKALLKKMSVNLDRQSKKIISEAELHTFRGIPSWVGFVDNQPVTLHTSYFAKRKPNAWSPYMNGYIAFTIPEYRRRHYASSLYLHVRELAVKSGCLRLKSTAATVIGIRMHQYLGDHIWAYDPNNRVVVMDTPLVDASRFPQDTPISVRKYTNRTAPMSADEVEHILNTQRLAYE